MPHQKAALLDVANAGIVYKISDEARRQQPFDAFKLSYARAYMVCVFDRECVVIDVRDWKGGYKGMVGLYRFSV